MFFRIFQYLGLLFIASFCAISVFLSTSARDLRSNASDSFLLTYASFFEDRFFDLRMKMTLKKNDLENRIVLAAIDDQSLNKIGRWPWTRTKHAQVVDKLGTFGAKIIAFDIFYSEPELLCNAVSPDKVFRDSLKKFQSVPGRKIILPYAVDIKYSKEIDESTSFKEAPDQLLNFMQFQQ
jgi:adenylate cyclase